MRGLILSSTFHLSVQHSQHIGHEDPLDIGRASLGYGLSQTFGITNTSFRLAVMVCGWMAGNSLRAWDHMQQSLSPTVVVQLTVVNTNTLTRFIWILLLAIASQLAVSGMHSSWLIMQHSTTGLLVLRISHWMPSLTPSGCFVLWLVPLLNSFIVTVTSSSLALPSASTSLTTTPKLLQRRPSIYCPMVWSSPIGRLWFIWDALTSPKSKCHGLSGSTQSSIQLG